MTGPRFSGGPGRLNHALKWGRGRSNHALQKGAGNWFMAMNRPFPSHTPKSEIRPENLSDDSYVSEIKNKKGGLDGPTGLIGPPEVLRPPEVPRTLGVPKFSGFQGPRRLQVPQESPDHQGSVSSIGYSNQRILCLSHQLETCIQWFQPFNSKTRYRQVISVWRS
jgi:hypothetical protein